MMKKRLVAIFLAATMCFTSTVSYAGEEKEKTDSSPAQEIQEQSKPEDEVEPEETRRGWYKAEEGWYYYNADGELMTGWQFIDGYWYYLDGNNIKYPGLMVSNGRREISGKEYWFGETGVLKIGWIYNKGIWYYSDQSGVLYEGWLKDNGSWFYFDKSDTEHPKSMSTNCRKYIGGSEYWFEAGGYMKTGWIYEDEHYYYARSNGSLSSGWEKISNVWYYFDAEDLKYPKVMLSDCKRVIGSKEYWFDEYGHMRTGWVKDENVWYYIQENGSKASGWIQLGSTWYYLDPNNAVHPYAMVADCKMKIDGEEYWFGSSGAMKTGWLYEDSYWYFLSSSGRKVSGWQWVDNYYYYLDPQAHNRMLQNTWKQLDGSWYYLKSNGAMATGWQWVNGEWYYFRGSGKMVTGWIKVGGTWYYMYPSGKMARDTTIDGYKIGSSGAMLNLGLTSMYNRIYWKSSPTAYLIAVDRSSRKVGIYKGGKNSWNNVYTWDCTVGAPSTPTITGTFQVGNKGYYFDSKEGFRCYYYTQISGDYLFHSVLYHKNGTLADGRLGMALSHGCVRMNINNAKWIYDNIPRRSTIVIY